MLLIYIKIFSQRTKLKQSTMDSNENILFLNLSIKCRFYEGKYSRNIALIINSQEKNPGYDTKISGKKFSLRKV